MLSKKSLSSSLTLRSHEINNKKIRILIEERNDFIKPQSLPLTFAHLSLINIKNHNLSLF